MKDNESMFMPLRKRAKGCDKQGKQQWADVFAIIADLDPAWFSADDLHFIERYRTMKKENDGNNTIDG